VSQVRVQQFWTSGAPYGLARQGGARRGTWRAPHRVKSWGKRHTSRCARGAHRTTRGVGSRAHD